MIDFKLQRFAGGSSDGGVESQTYEGPHWLHFTGMDVGDYYFGFVPSGSSVEGSGGMADQMADNGITTIQIRGVSGVTGDGSAVTISCLAIENVEVTGEGASGLTLTVDGTKYRVGEDGKLVEAAEILSTSVVNKTKRADGKVISKTLNFINPAASDKDISTFMAALNSLSKNETIKGGTIIVEKRVL